MTRSRHGRARRTAELRSLASTLELMVLTGRSTLLTETWTDQQLRMPAAST